MTNIKLITDEKQKTAWNEIVTHPLQTWEWGEIREKSGNQILRVAVIDSNNKISQAFLFTVHPVALGKVIINYAKGPMVPNSVLEFLKKHFGKQTIFVKLEPETYLESAGKHKLPIAKNSWQTDNLDFYLSRSPVFARHTFIVDLTLTEDKLLGLMKTKTRYNINLAKRKGVVIKDETNNPTAFDTFFTLYQQTVKRQNYLGHSREYHHLVWVTLKQEKIARILTAYYENKPLSSYTLFIYKNKAYYLYGGSSNQHKEVMASNLLMWEALLLSKKLGCTSFDMWGALEKNYPSSHSWAGFHRFKEGYGGTHHSYLPTIDVVFAPVQYFLFTWVWPIRLKLLTFLRFFS